MALRFFIGILGGSFVPCQVWSTAFFDKNVVGTANALTGGFGNAGGGITYFVMPAIFDSLVARHSLTPHVAWRVTFLVPFILITATAIALLVLCPDTPTGRWADRHIHAAETLAAHGVAGEVVDIPGSLTDHKELVSGSTSVAGSDEKLKDDPAAKPPALATDHHDQEAAQIGDQALLDSARGEVIVKPTFKEAMHVICSLQTLTLCACYFNSFGAELAINSILSTYYLKNFPKLGQTGAGNWAAMFGLLNVFFRPAGGIVSDIIYKHTKSLWAKKMWIHFVGIVTGAFMLAIGLVNSHNQATMFGLVAGMAFFLDAGNGANFALVPHVHPFANGKSQSPPRPHTSHRSLSINKGPPSARVTDSKQASSPASLARAAISAASSSPSSSATTARTTAASSGSSASSASP
jgi:NNP family nitrate/nitrite transporter-like MFS transporter